MFGGGSLVSLFCPEGISGSTIFDGDSDSFGSGNDVALIIDGDADSFGIGGSRPTVIDGGPGSFGGGAGTRIFDGDANSFGAGGITIFDGDSNSFGNGNGSKSITIYTSKKDESKPTGGTYSLDDPETGQVMRSGRSGDLERRRGEHARNPLYRLLGLIFNTRDRTDDYAEQRGLEQDLHDRYKPPLNKVKPISDKNPQRQDYLDAVERYRDREKKK